MNIYILFIDIYQYLTFCHTCFIFIEIYTFLVDHLLVSYNSNHDTWPLNILVNPKKDTVLHNCDIILTTKKFNIYSNIAHNQMSKIINILLFLDALPCAKYHRALRETKMKKAQVYSPAEVTGIQTPYWEMGAQVLTHKWSSVLVEEKGVGST